MRFFHGVIIIARDKNELQQTLNKLNEKSLDRAQDNPENKNNQKEQNRAYLFLYRIQDIGVYITFPFFSALGHFVSIKPDCSLDIISPEYLQFTDAPYFVLRSPFDCFIASFTLCSCHITRLLPFQRGWSFDYTDYFLSFPNPRIFFTVSQ